MAKSSDKSITTKSNIIEAAIHEFSKVGYDRARISDIVALAGYTQRTFYIYFNSKEYLYKELVSKWVTGLEETFETAKYETDYRILIEQRWNSILAYMLDNPEYTRCVFLLNPFFEEDVRQPLHKKIMAMMKWQQNRGLMKKTIMLEIMAESTFATIMSLALKYVLEKGISPTVIAKQIAEIYYDGLAEKG